MQSNILGTFAPRVTNVIALHGRFRATKEAIRFPGEPAKTYTYGQFANEMDAVASFMAPRFKGKRVATLLTNDSPRTLSTMFGCVRGGACLVPLNATLKPHQIQGMLKDCDAKMVIASEKYVDLIPQSAQGFERVGLDFSNSAWSSSQPLFQKPTTPVIEDTSDSAEFNIIYSSGTTGLPKGATLNVMKQFDPVQTLEIIQREKITHVFMVPTQLKMCVEAGASKYDLSSLKMVLSAGSTLAGELKKKVLEQITPNLFELYGNSEGFASMLFPEEHATKFYTVGRPLLGNDVKIVEAEGDKELADPEQVGEICVRGPGMMLGYNNHENNASSDKDIWTDPRTSLKYFRSGDMGKLDTDGYLSLMERKKDMIISGGFNVFPKDIEEIMLGHEAIHDVAIVAGPHEKWGETPVAIVIPKPGAAAEKLGDAIKEWTNARVSKVQRVHYVKVLQSTDAFPRNVLGKVMKKDLRSRLEEWGVPKA